MKHQERHTPPPTWREAGYIFVHGEILLIQRRGNESRSVRLEEV
jgi:hypothetical protein